MNRNIYNNICQVKNKIVASAIHPKKSVSILLYLPLIAGLIYAGDISANDRPEPPNLPDGVCAGGTTPLTSTQRVENFHSCRLNRPMGDKCTTHCWDHLTTTDHPLLNDTYTKRVALYQQCLKSPKADAAVFGHTGERGQCCKHLRISDRSPLAKTLNRQVCGLIIDDTTIEGGSYHLKKTHLCVRNGESDGSCFFGRAAPSCGKAKAMYREWLGKLVNNDACTQCGPGSPVEKSRTTSRVKTENGSCG